MWPTWRSRTFQLAIRWCLTLSKRMSCKAYEYAWRGASILPLFFLFFFFPPLRQQLQLLICSCKKKKKKKLPLLEHCKNTDILHCCTSSSQCNLQKLHILTKDKQKAHCRKMNRKKNRLRRCATHGKEHISAVKEEKKSFSPVSSKLRKIAIRSLLLLE